jgi:hypothetical protein
MCREWCNLDDKPLQLALDEETPFLLNYSTYNSTYGLILDATNPSNATDDGELD